MNKNKVEFQGSNIVKNGRIVGRLEGDREVVYVCLYTSAVSESGEALWKHLPDAVARFKYNRPRTSAKHFIKWALQNFSQDEILNSIGFHLPYDQNRKAPLTWAEENGYKIAA
jgi:hypothetical protein